MKKLAIALLLLLAPAISRAADYSQQITITPVQVIPAGQDHSRVFLRLINVASTGGASVWCSRSLGNNTAANAPGAYELPAGGAVVEAFAAPGFVPQEGIWCVAASGSVPLTAEAVQ